MAEDYEDIKGTVFNIQKYSLHDGPGIRTTVFLKGCPLSCKWCSNPESQSRHPEIMIFNTRCIGCGGCVEACLHGAIKMGEGRIIGIDREKCDLCYKCTDICPSKALEVTGKIMSVTEVMKVVMQDVLFYANSGGGVTFSGGEPLMQHEFLSSLLKAAKKSQLHTALDTSGSVSWKWINDIMDDVDLVLYDVKHMNPDMHKKWTGVDNRQILENLEELASRKDPKIWIRIPVIPGFNDTRENIGMLKEFLKDIRADKISLLPYHTWGVAKYEKLGLKYPLMDTEPMDTERCVWIKSELEECGMEIAIGH
ncbi:MAG: glycyl-radical enzyme activating protein [Deltaproteobacteria bacterium]|nr:glycyl-radical enzyme activating protein [Deltaproteobacteria bacterium]MBW1931349.1 glycyl-radical enzyme activating protein [Deltaproteobacteria bacterium]MBW2027008.1 glycyl-radical enzyme activating protein [Deltaproteobacteria bacterium]MBW2126990.1 glycyl-radical enzyme activating protein [Deltaproteobacteria bacterium]